MRTRETIWHASATTRSTSGWRPTEWRARATRSCATAKFDDFAGGDGLRQPRRRAAEEANHHPDILVHGWNKVRLTLTTHSEGGLTAADFELAERIDGSPDGSRPRRPCYRCARRLMNDDDTSKSGPALAG